MIALALLAWAQEAWLTPNGAGGYPWGSNDVPDGVPRPRDIDLPDSGFIGATKAERPEDLELVAPEGERRFVRYVHGVLVDAWWVSTRPLDPAALTVDAIPTWTGAILGPADGGWSAYGKARSWDIGGRTVLHWSARDGSREIIAARALPTPQYGIGRPTPLGAPTERGASPRLTGDLRSVVRDRGEILSGCFLNSPKPVEVHIALAFDASGMPSRVKVSSDQPAFEIQDCVAGALMEVKGAPRTEGALTMTVFR